MSPATSVVPQAPLLKRLKQDLKAGILANFAFSFCINAMMLLPSIYMLQVYDRVLSSRNLATLVVLTVLILALYGLMAGLEWVRSRLLVRLGLKMEEYLDKPLFAAAFRSQLIRRDGDIRQAISDLSTIRTFLTGGRFQSFLDAPWAPIYLIFCFLLHPILGGFALGACVVLLTLAYVTEKVTRQPLLEANLAAQQANRFAGNQLASAEAIETMGMLPSICTRWLEKQQQMLHMQAIASDKAGVSAAVTRFVRVSVQSLALGLGAYLVIVENLTPGAMVAVTILISRALAPIESIIGNLQAMEGAFCAYRRLNEILQPSKFPPENETSLPRPLGNVSVESLYAAPPGVSDFVLKGLEFSITAGETIVVVGPSGSGKSTLARLLTGVWPCSRGAVRLDGADVFRWNKAQLGKWLGYLPQDVEMLEGTVAENISRFNTGSSEKIIQAAKLANVHDLILRLPQGYDTPLGESGSNLSGGQRQRIALARAIYDNPALVVLDEPNSNLDEQGEAGLLETVSSLKRQGTTTVIISHRKGIVGIADKLLILNEGCVVAYAPPAEIQRAIAAKQSSRQSVQEH